ncbi:MAG TPA: HU family DNA-binding protein [Nitrospirota bacterium]|nr:HU family DNA-binding protein [Nitrospirota bacterium]
MAKAMTKPQLVTKVAKKASITKKAAGEILDFIAEIACKETKNSFTLPGLGKLVLVHRKARMGRNFVTGKAIRIKATKAIKFRVAKAANDAILGTK